MDDGNGGVGGLKSNQYPPRSATTGPESARYGPAVHRRWSSAAETCPVPDGGSRKQTANESWSFKKLGSRPIIAMSALLRLVEWYKSREMRVQGGDSCPTTRKFQSPPAPNSGTSGNARSTLESASTREAATCVKNTQSCPRSSARDTSNRKGGER